MKKQITENFVLSYQEELAPFIQDSLAIFAERKTLIRNVFGEIPDEKILSIGKRLLTILKQFRTGTSRPE